MKIVTALTMGVVLLGTSLTFAQETQVAMAKAPTTSPTAESSETKLVEVGNKICPVSNEEVGKNGMEPYKVTYNGKVYNLCCSMCAKDFNKDPEKYSKMMDEEVAKEAVR
jgi:YHS domain-containing protein